MMTKQRMRPFLAPIIAGAAATAILGTIGAGSALAGGIPHGGSWDANAHVKGDTCLTKGHVGGWMVDDSGATAKWVCSIDDTPEIARGAKCFYHTMPGQLTVFEQKWYCVTPHDKNLNPVDIVP